MPQSEACSRTCSLNFGHIGDHRPWDRGPYNCATCGDHMADPVEERNHIAWHMGREQVKVHGES